MKVVKFKLNLEGLNAAEMLWRITKPCGAIRANSYHSTFKKWTGWNGYENTYRNKPCIKCTAIKWDISSAMVMDIPEADMSSAYYCHNLDKCEVFFGPQVAVGDLIVPVDGVSTQLACGFVCGEGTEWAVVYCNDGEHSPDTSTIPNVGKVYALATAKAAGLRWAQDLEISAA